ncbi:MAG: Gp138 family membrane-puncturing spike protein, partial [Bradymonadaceae bacterium]
TDEIERRSMPVVPNVPVAFPSAGSMQMTWPLEEGDTVLMLWSERSLDEWLTTGASRTQPSDNRRHDVSDAIALPQLRSFADAVEATGDNVVLNTDSGLEIHLGTPDPSQYVALADDVEGELESTRSTYNSHTHNYMVPASPAGTVPTQGPNQTRSSIGDVGADDVKAK